MPKGHSDSEILHVGRIFKEEPTTRVGPEGGKRPDFSSECFQVQSFLEESRGGNIERAQEEFGMWMSIPFTKKMVWTYVAFLRQRGMKAESIRNYLSAIRSEHLVRGYCPEGLMPDLLNQFLDGMKKLGNQEGKSRERGAVTMERLLIIRQWIKLNIF